jgi:Na+/H+ antiporter NhaD/arsenite permease-like protein
MVVAIVGLVYLGMIFGGIPRLQVNRTGVALVGAMALVVSGSVSLEEARAFVDLPTLLLLFSMMVISAQLRLGGFYFQLVRRLGSRRFSSGSLLAAVVFVGGGLSAVFTNDVVALVMAPLLIHACGRRRISPVPVLLALACAVNVGSAATLVGNPQNILIGQSLKVSFGGYLALALPSTLLGLTLIWFLTMRIWKAEMVPGSVPPLLVHPAKERPFDSWQTAKGLSLAVTVLFLFLFTPLPREAVGMGAAALILLSRRFHTREMLGLVDWELMVLFLGLFVVNGALLETGSAHRALLWLQTVGVDLSRTATLFLVTPLLSLAVSNVPATMLLLPAAQGPTAGAVLALSSTLAGNALIIGSVANFIVLEQAGRMGVTINWRQHAALGVPVTLGTLALAAGALWVAGAALG